MNTPQLPRRTLAAWGLAAAAALALLAPAAPAQAQPMLFVDSSTTQAGGVDEGTTLIFELFTTGGNLSSGTVVPVTVSQMGNFIDGTAPTMVTFAGGGTATLQIPTEDDSVHEADGTVTVTIQADTQSPARWTLSTSTMGTNDVRDNDDPPLIRFSSPSVEEGGTLEYIVSAHDASGAQIAVGSEVSWRWVAFQGTATKGTDYTAPQFSEAAMIAVGATEATISITTTDDSDDEGNETVIIGISQLMNGDFEVDKTATELNVTGTIVDNDRPRVNITADDADNSVAEGEDVVFTVTSSDMPANGLTVELVLVTVGNVAAVLQPNILTRRTVTIPAGGSSVKTTVATDDDNTDEDDGNIEAQLFTLPSTHSFGTVTRSTVTVTDNEGQPTITIPQTINSSDTADNVVITLTMVPASGATRGPVTEKTATVTFMTDDNSAIAGTDYTAIPSTTLTFQPGSNTANITIDIIGPDADEDDDFFAVEFTSSMNVAVLREGGGPSLLEIGLLEKPSLSLDRVGPATVDESDGTATFTVSITQPQTVPVTVPVTVSETGNALAGGQPTSVVIPARQSSATLNIPLDNDRRDEDSSTVTVTIALPTVNSDAYSLSTRLASVIVNNDDAPPSVSVVPGARINEGRELVFLVRLSAPSERQVTVEYATASGTATEGEDFAKAEGALTFPPNATEMAVRVQTIRDQLDDPDETLTLTLTLPSDSNATLGAATGEGVIFEGLDPDQIRALNEAILPHLAAAVGEETGLAIQDRLRAGIKGGAPAQRLPTPLQSLADSPMQTLAALAQNRPTYGLQHLDFALGFAGSARGLSESEQGAPAGFGVWGRGYFRDLSADMGVIDLDGEITGIMLGADTRIGSSLLGLALNHTLAEVDWQESEFDFTGSHETTLTGVHPYFGYQNSHGVVVWGSLGYALGEAELTDDDRPNFSYKRDLALRTAAFGAYGPLLERGSLSLGMMADASHTTLEERGLGTHAEVAQTSVSARWLRAGLSFGWDSIQAGGAGMSANAEVALRRDFDDAKSGKGVEVGGGFAYSTAGGLRVNVDARYLALHDADVDEFGVSGSVAYTASAAGKGFTFTFRPEYGAIQSAKEALWNGAFSQSPATGMESLLSRRESRAPALSYALEVKYGIPVLQGKELLTVFARTNLRAAASSHAWGADFKLGQHFTTGLETLLRPEAAAPSDHRAYLRYHRAF